MQSNMQPLWDTWTSHLHSFKHIFAGSGTVAETIGASVAGVADDDDVAVDAAAPRPRMTADGDETPNQVLLPVVVVVGIS